MSITPGRSCKKHRKFRIACSCSYLGTHFSGWQIQSGRETRTVQGEIEKALFQTSQTAIRTQCAARTDSGVHAQYQVFHFDTHLERSPFTWAMSLNALLPRDIRIQSCHLVDQQHFSARYSARYRQYFYLIENSRFPSAALHNFSWHVPVSLDVPAMQVCLQLLLGKQDFSSFRAASCQAKSPLKHIQSLSLEQDSSLLIVRIRADSFLHHMVRNILGTCVEVGMGKISLADFEQLLKAKNRNLAGKTAPSKGLCLTDIGYTQDCPLAKAPRKWLGFRV